MNNKIFYGALLVVLVGGLSYGITQKKPEAPRPGVEHSDNGREHVSTKEYTGEEPPTSGEHASPIDWGVYSQEIPEANAIHNLEHGGIYISYKSDLPKEQIEKLEALFSKPFSNPEFAPTKAILGPRDENKAAIVISSWVRSQMFESYDEAAIIEYYNKNIGKSPEPRAR